MSASLLICFSLYIYLSCLKSSNSLSSSSLFLSVSPYLLSIFPLLSSNISSYHSLSLGLSLYIIVFSLDSSLSFSHVLILFPCIPSISLSPCVFLSLFIRIFLYHSLYIHILYLNTLYILHSLRLTFSRHSPSSPVYSYLFYNSISLYLFQ